MLRQYIKEESEKLGLFIPGLEIKENPRTRKSYRLESLQPLFANKRVFIQSNMQALENELLLYPRGKNDDLLDGFYYANKNSYRPGHTYTPFSKKREDYYYTTQKSWKIN